MPFCEDYPCCGHEMGDCDGSLYGSDESIKAEALLHLYCEHEAGVYDCYDYRDDDEIDPMDCEHGDASQSRRRGWECDICGVRLKVVTDVSPMAYPSKVVPGLWVEIPVLGWHLEAA